MAALHEGDPTAFYVDIPIIEEMFDGRSELRPDFLQTVHPMALERAKAICTIPNSDGVYSADIVSFSEPKGYVTNKGVEGLFRVCLRRGYGADPSLTQGVGLLVETYGFAPPAPTIMFTPTHLRSDLGAMASPRARINHSEDLHSLFQAMRAIDGQNQVAW